MKLFSYSQTSTEHPLTFGTNDKWFRSAHYDGCNCLSMLALNSKHVNKRVPWKSQTYNRIFSHDRQPKDIVHIRRSNHGNPKQQLRRPSSSREHIQVSFEFKFNFFPITRIVNVVFAKRGTFCLGLNVSFISTKLFLLTKTKKLTITYKCSCASLRKNAFDRMADW